MTFEADSVTAMFAKLYTLYKENNNCDFQLISADNQKINAHSFVLCAGIPKLRKSIIENFKKDTTKLRLKEVRGRELELLVQFAYLKKCDVLGSEDRSALVDLIKAAEYMQMTDLEGEMLLHLSENLDMELALKVLAKKDTKNMKHALPLAEQYVFRHLLEEGAPNLGFEEFKDLLADGRLHAPYEEMVWEAIVKWISADYDDRSTCLVPLMTVMRVGFLSPENISSISNHPWVTTNEKALLALQKATGVVQKYQEPSSALLKEKLPMEVRPRLPHVSILAIGGWRVDVHLCKMAEVYDAISDNWIEVPNLKPALARGYHGLEMIGKCVYLVGGGDLSKSLNTCLKLDLTTLVWSPIASMTAARCFVSTAVLNDELYAIGGRELEHRLRTAEKYNPKTDNWTKIAETHLQHSDAAAAALDGKVYVVGGFNGHEVLNTLECYSPDTNTWMTLTPMNKPRSGLTCVAHRGQLFVFGGFDGTQRLSDGERYNPLTRTWTTLAPMKQARSTFQMVRVGDVLFAMGGYSDKPEGTVEAYDIIGDKWYIMSSMLAPTSAMACVAVDDLTFAQSVWSDEDRSDPCQALRDLTREYPPFHPPDAGLSLPEGTVEIHRPQLPDALPVPWAELFLTNDQFDLSDEELEILQGHDDDAALGFFESDISTDRDDY